MSQLFFFIFFIYLFFCSNLFPLQSERTHSKINRSIGFCTFATTINLARGKSSLKREKKKKCRSYAVMDCSGTFISTPLLCQKKYAVRFYCDRKSKLKNGELSFTTVTILHFWPTRMENKRNCFKLSLQCIHFHGVKSPSHAFHWSVLRYCHFMTAKYPRFSKKRTWPNIFLYIGRSLFRLDQWLSLIEFESFWACFLWEIL